MDATTTLALASGGFGLLGVVIGVVGTTGMQMLLDGRRERREGERAKVLVTGELLQDQRIMQALALIKHWPNTDPDAMLPTSAWRENRSRLAGHLDEDTFNALVMIYSILEIDRSHFVMASERPLEMSDSTAELLEKNANDIAELRRSMGARGSWPDYSEEEKKALREPAAMTATKKAGSA
jgi:hypothetical protein